MARKENPVKASLRPWEVEQIGEYYLPQSHTQNGTDGNRYQIDAGTYPIVGKVTNDSRRLLLDTALVYTGRQEQTREEALIPMKMHAIEISQLQSQGKAKVNDDFKARVESLAKGVEQGREMTASLGMRR
jgi:hypothetical protein